MKDYMTECLRVAADVELFAATGVPPDVAFRAMRVIRHLANYVTRLEEDARRETLRFESVIKRNEELRAKCRRIAQSRKRRSV